MNDRTAHAADGNAGATGDRIATGLVPLGEIMRLARTLPEDIASSVAIDGHPRRIRIGRQTGEVWADGEDWTGVTLTVETGTVTEALAMAFRLAEGPVGAPLARALARFTPSERERLRRGLPMAAAELRVMAASGDPADPMTRKAGAVADLLDRLAAEACRAARQSPEPAREAAE